MEPEAEKRPGVAPGPVRTEYQRLEDLACAHWWSEVFFSALELNIFELLGRGDSSAGELASGTGWDRDALTRLLAVLTDLDLVVEFDGRYANSALAARYLVAASPEYLGDFLAYRRYIAPHWQRLPERVRRGPKANERPVDEAEADYRERVLAYVRALFAQARLKAREAAQCLSPLLDPPQTILDLGGGAGAWGRIFVQTWPGARAVLLDLPEVLWAAKRLLPDPGEWAGLDCLAADLLKPCLKGQSFDLIVLSNVVHAYGLEELPVILEKTAGLLSSPQGTVVIHDYLTGDSGASPLKGRLYDLHMMLNTYNGRIFGLDDLTGALERAGLHLWRTIHLRTDSSLLLARKQPPTHQSSLDTDLLAMKAKSLGFVRARIVSPQDIAVRPWVRVKCAYGCAGYNSNWQCPPNSIDEKKMAEILVCYNRAILVQGTPPGRRFHEMLRELERFCFLAGHHQALAFGAGPCPVCQTCDTSRPCLFPAKARPALEACGVDVYETARRAGWELEPVQEPLDGVKYIGLVLVE